MRRRAGVDWRAVGALYAREVRAALRDRTIVVHLLLVPVVLYPFLLWVALWGIAFVRGRTSETTSRVAAFGLEAEPALRRELHADPRVAVIPASSPPAAVAAALGGSLDAVLEVLPPGPGEASPRVRMTFAGAKERSAAARERLAALLDRARERALRSEGEAKGLSGPAWALFTLETRNVATGREMGRHLLGLLLPLLLVVMVSAGCFTAAIDATAGERERSTWETLMTVGASRSSVVAAKSLYVLTFGALAGLLGFGAMALAVKPVAASLWAGPAGSLDVSIPAAGIPVILAGALVLAAFLAAAMLLLAAFARTFKEGQAMLAPLFLLATLPAAFLAAPGVELTAPLALVPVVNVSLVVRDAISGTFRWGEIAVTGLSSLLAAAAALRLAASVLSAEEVATGTFVGGPGAFLGGRVREAVRAREERAP